MVEITKEKLLANKKILITIGGVLTAVVLVAIVTAILLSGSSAPKPSVSESLVQTSTQFEEYEEPAGEDPIVYTDDPPEQQTTVTEPTTTTTEPTTTPDPEHNFNRKGVKGKRFGEKVSAQDQRLPNTTIPLEYDLKVKIYLPGHGWVSDTAKNMTFEGEVSIQIQTSSKISEIVLNSVDLKFDESKCSVVVDNTQIRIESIEEVPKLQMIFVNLVKPIEANKQIVLKFVYSGPIRKDLSGLYPTTYRTSSGEIRMGAVTQMEPIDARKVVACYDEPAMKAPWIVTIIHPKGTTALSNQIEKETVAEGDDFLRSTFEKTPKMSTYLLAFFVSDFVYNEAQTDSGVRVRVWSRPEEKNSTLFALETGVKLLNHYEKLFGIPFPLKKIDMPAVPDFLSAAMENWGLITYREDVLLAQNTTGPMDKRNIVIALAHELAHQWFGNLVTMKWWDDLWLNEAFATYIMYIEGDNVTESNFRLKPFFKMDALVASMLQDSLVASHPIRSKIDDVNEIVGMFDEITYMKGSMVIYMIAELIGKDNFDKGIRNYLSKHSYGNADTNDLIAALQEQTPSVVGGRTDFKVGDFLNQWTEQMGYPLVTVKRINSTRVSVEQERFLTGPKPNNSSDRFIWDIPLWTRSHINGTNDIKLQWLTNKSMEIETAENSLEIFNYQSMGYYRVNYDNATWDGILQSGEYFAEHLKFPTETTLRLIHDLFAFAPEDRVDYAVAMNFLKSLMQHDTMSYEPWAVALDAVKEMFVHIAPDNLTSVLGFFNLESSKSDEGFNFIKENYLDEKQVATVETWRVRISISCIFGISKYEETSCHQMIQKRIFKAGFIEKCKSQELSKCSDIPVPLRNVYYCEMMRLANSSEVQVIEEWFKMEQNAAESRALLHALACAGDAKLIEKYLMEVTKKTGGMFKPQEIPGFMKALVFNPTSRGVLLDFLTAHFDEIEQAVAIPSIVNQSMLPVFMRLSTPEDLEKFSKWVDNTPNAKKYGFGKLKAYIERRVEFRKRYT